MFSPRGVSPGGIVFVFLSPPYTMRGKLEIFHAGNIFFRRIFRIFAGRFFAGRIVSARPAGFSRRVIFECITRPARAPRISCAPRRAPAKGRRAAGGTSSPRPPYTMRGKPKIFHVFKNIFPPLYTLFIALSGAFSGAFSSCQALARREITTMRGGAKIFHAFKKIFEYLCAKKNDQSGKKSEKWAKKIRGRHLPPPFRAIRQILSWMTCRKYASVSMYSSKLRKPRL